MPPAEFTSQPRSIMVPVTGSHASMQAVALACELARKNRGKVYVVHVIEVQRTLPLDAQVESDETAGDDILSQAQQIATDQNFDVEGEILHARDAGPAIVDEAIERGVDLIILGMAYPKRFGEFQLGRVVQYVLRSAPCEVWMCRHPAEE